MGACSLVQHSHVSCFCIAVLTYMPFARCSIAVPRAAWSLRCQTMPPTRPTITRKSRSCRIADRFSPRPGARAITGWRLTASPTSLDCSRTLPRQSLFLQLHVQIGYDGCLHVMPSQHICHASFVNQFPKPRLMSAVSSCPRGHRAVPAGCHEQERVQHQAPTQHALGPSQSTEHGMYSGMVIAAGKQSVARSDLGPSLDNMKYSGRTPAGDRVQS